MRDFARALEMAALDNCSEFTPMPFSPAQIAARSDADPVTEMRPALATSTEIESNVSAARSWARRHGPRLKAALAGMATLIVVVATGLFFVDTRSGTSVSKPTLQASVASLSTAQVGPVAPTVALGKDLNEKATIAKQPSSPPPSKKKTVSLAAIADPFDSAPTPSGKGPSKKANPFASPSAPRARRSASRGDWPYRRDLARPDSKRTIFEDL